MEEREGEGVVEADWAMDGVGGVLGGWLEEGVALAEWVMEGEGVVEGLA